MPVHIINDFFSVSKKKEAEKKISKILFIFLSLITLLFSGCGKDSVDTSLQNEIKNILYEFTLSGLENENSSFPYLPDSLKLLLNRNVVSNGKFYTIFELCFFDKVDIKKEVEVTEKSVEEVVLEENSKFLAEEERMSEEFDDMEDFVQTSLYSNDEREKAFEASSRVSKANTLEVTSADDTLSYMEFEDELFLPQKNGDGWIFINAAKEKVTRSFYDSLFRCYHEEKWIIDSSKEELVKEQDTSFYDDTYKISSRSITSNNTKKQQKYNKNGLLINEKLFKINNEKNIIESSRTLEYDKENRIIESDEVEYFYKDDTYKDLDYSFNKRYVYKYKGPKKKNKEESEIPPDFDYYEDGCLKIRKTYTSVDTYTNQTFFSEGFSVTSYYENGKLIKEVFVTNNDNERIKNHE